MWVVGRRRTLLAALAGLLACGLPAPLSASGSVPGNGRAWELVTSGQPPASDFAAPTPIDPSGTRMVYVTRGPLAGSSSGTGLSLNLATRGASGWTNTPLGFPYKVESESILTSLSPFLPVGPTEGEEHPFLLSSIPLSDQELPEGDAAIYRPESGGGFTMIAIVGQIGPLELLFYEGLIEIPQHGGKVVFSDAEHLVPSDAGRTEGSSIYESVGTSLRQADVGDGGLPLSTCGSTVSHHGGVSNDGSRVYFTNPADSSTCPEPSEVYLREDGDQTTEVSASQCTRPDCDAPQSATFLGATPDGESVFLSTAQQLTNDDHDSSVDLYRYDVGDGKLNLLSGGSPVLEGAPTQHLAYPSEDGSYVYFYASGSLLPGQCENAECLYLADPSGLHLVSPGGPVGSEETVEMEVQLSRNGHVALFTTTGAGEGGDTDGRSDAYLYDADADALTRLSKGPSGGNGEFGAVTYSEVNQELVAGKSLFYRSLSEDGKDAFFTTREALLPEDTNAFADVYEWREGQLGLVSSGTGPKDVVFGGASPDGGTAFFQTWQTLLPADQNGGEADIYAARRGGGFPEAPTVPPCEGSLCVPLLPARLQRSRPASARGGEERGIRFLKLVDTGDGPAILLAVPSAGQVMVAGVKPRGDSRRLARGKARASQAGTLRVPLRLTDELEKALAGGAAVKLRLEIRERSLRLARTIVLHGARR